MVIKNMFGRSVCTGMSDFNTSEIKGGEKNE